MTIISPTEFGANRKILARLLLLITHSFEDFQQDTQKLI